MSNSSRPKCPASPACGFKPKTAIRGGCKEKCRSKSMFTMRKVARSRSRCDGARHIAQGQVRGDQRHPQLIVDQQHHGQRRASSFRKIFGMAAETVSGIHEGTFLHRRGHHGRKFAVGAAVAGTVQHFNHVGCIAYIRMPGHDLAARRDVHDLQGAVAMRLGKPRGVVAFESQGQPKRRSRGRQQVRVGGNHQVGFPVSLRQTDAGIRSHTGGFPRRNDDARYVHYILVSTKASSRKRRNHNSVSSSALLSRIAANAFCRRTSSVLS